jgi:hypothetical protein
MNYFVTKSSNRIEYRIYTSDEVEVEGTTIYKGHKLGVDDNLLLEILDVKIEKSTGKIHFLKYDKVVTEPDRLDLNMWIVGRTESLNRNLQDCWSTLDRTIRQKFGEFKKIIITRVNI